MWVLSRVYSPQPGRSGNPSLLHSIGIIEIHIRARRKEIRPGVAIFENFSDQFFFHANFGIALKFWKVLENVGNFSRHPIAQANSLRNHVPARKFPKSLRFSPGFHHWREETGQRAYAGFRIVCARSRDSIRSALGRILKSWFSATPYFLGSRIGYIHIYTHTHTYTRLKSWALAPEPSDFRGARHIVTTGLGQGQ